MAPKRAGFFQLNFILFYLYWASFNQRKTSTEKKSLISEMLFRVNVISCTKWYFVFYGVWKTCNYGVYSWRMTNSKNHWKWTATIKFLITNFINLLGHFIPFLFDLWSQQQEKKIIISGRLGPASLCSDCCFWRPGTMLRMNGRYSKQWLIWL